MSITLNPWYHRPEYYTGKDQQWYRISPALGQSKTMCSIYFQLTAQKWVCKYNPVTHIIWVRKRSDSDLTMLLMIVGDNPITEHTKLV